MKPLIAATEFEICISMSDMVSWLDETSEMPEKNQDLEIIFDLLGVKVNALALYEDYFHNKTGTGRANVHVYEIKDDPLTVVAIDLLTEPTDQMDLIQLYIRCKSSVAAEISLLVSKFFNNASAQVALS